MVTRILFKANCRIKELTPFLLRVFDVLDWMGVARKIPVKELTITSIYDGVHSKNSKHYTGNAVDVRSKNFPSSSAKREFMALLEEELDNYGFAHTVLLEDEGKPNEHFHVQVKKT